MNQIHNLNFLNSHTSLTRLTKNYEMSYITLFKMRVRVIQSGDSLGYVRKLSFGSKMGIMKYLEKYKGKSVI